MRDETLWKLQRCGGPYLEIEAPSKVAAFLVGACPLLSPLPPLRHVVRLPAAACWRAGEQPARGIDRTNERTLERNERPPVRLPLQQHSALRARFGDCLLYLSPVLCTPYTLSAVTIHLSINQSADSTKHS